MDIKKEIEKVAAGQRIPLTAEENQTFSSQLEQVLDAFDQMDKIDTKNVEPSYHPLDVPTQLRADTPEASTVPTQNSRRLEKGYLRGPRMMKHT